MDSNNILKIYRGADTWEKIDWLEGTEEINEKLSYSDIIEKLRINEIKLNKFKIISLLYNRFMLESISFSPMFAYPPINGTGPFEIKKIIKVILKMQRGNVYDIPNRRKTFSIYGVKYFENYFRFFSIYFRKINKKFRSNPTFDNIIRFLEREDELTPSPYSRHIPVDLREEIFKRDNYTCKYCGWKNGINGRKDKILTVDHIIPWKYGGTTKEENLITSCLDCNIKKNDKLLQSLLENSFKDKQNKEQDKGEEITKV